MHRVLTVMMMAVLTLALTAIALNLQEMSREIHGERRDRQ